jgi:hypothetical protein
MDNHDHSHITHSAGCDEEGCEFIAEVHAHNADEAALALSHNLADHNAAEHGIESNPADIKDAVMAKMKTHV